MPPPLPAAAGAATVASTLAPVSAEGLVLEFVESHPQIIRWFSVAHSYDTSQALLCLMLPETLVGER